MSTAAERLKELDHLIVAAHAAGEREELVKFYAEAGDLLEKSSTPGHTAFVRTQAYVYALETGNRAMAARLLAALRAAGRET